MTPAQKKLARHALGLPNWYRRSYRNSFVAGQGHSDYADWLAMVAAGEALRRDGASLPFGGDDLFRLTLSGAKAALEPGESLSLEDFPTAAPLKALSILQPWAWLIVEGFKPVENRTWGTNVRGYIAIHAGKGFDTEGWEYVRDRFPEIALPYEFERGGIVGMARLAGCVRRSDSPWFFGPFGFLMRDAHPVAFVPMKGALGFFDVPDDIAARIRHEPR